jgi:hypothetical protein
VLSDKRGSDRYTLNPKYAAACPNLRLKVAVATYSAPGANPPTLTLYGQHTAIVTPAHPHATVPYTLFPPGCIKSVELVVVLSADLSMPHQVPRSPQHILDTLRLERAKLIIGPIWGMPGC